MEDQVAAPEEFVQQSVGVEVQGEALEGSAQGAVETDPVLH